MKTIAAIPLEAINAESAREKQVPGEVEFYRSIADLIQQARGSLAKSVNTTMVITHNDYFEQAGGRISGRAFSVVMVSGVESG
jgi:hypothetical protein